MTNMPRRQRWESMRLHVHGFSTGTPVFDRPAYLSYNKLRHGNLPGVEQLPANEQNVAAVVTLAR